MNSSHPPLKQSLQRRGADGHFEAYQDVEKETAQLDATSVRTITRTFGRDANGAKTLVQVTEEEKHTLPGGDSNIVRTTTRNVPHPFLVNAHEVPESCSPARLALWQ